MTVLTQPPLRASASTEHFIPCHRHELIELCLADQRLSPQEAEDFRAFCQILSAYYHFRFHRILESVKTNYAPFNPNTDIRSFIPTTPDSLAKQEAQLIQDFRYLLEKSNYHELPPELLQAVLAQKSLVALKTDVDFDDFQHLLCFYRGETIESLKIKGILKSKTLDIESFGRVVLFIQFKPESYFEQKGISTQTLTFAPGKIYLYLYKNVPKYDLELLFPNVQTSMTWRDRILLAVPALGAGVAVALKIMPQLLLIVGVLLLIFEAPTIFDSLKASEKQAENLFPVMVATFSLLMALGGFGFKQYSNYKSKKIKFQKSVTDALFFRNMANHSAVLQMLVDVAEEQECKEVILAYYHLLTSPTPLTASELDTQIEAWLHQHLGSEINFDVPDALQKMQAIQGQGASSPHKSLLTFNPQGQCQVLSLPEAQIILDHLWDNAFQFNNNTMDPSGRHKAKSNYGH